MSEKAMKAVKHILDRVQTDPDFAHVMILTESHHLCCEAEAEETGEDVETVKDRRSVDKQPNYRRREPEIVVRRRQLRAAHRKLEENGIEFDENEE